MKEIILADGSVARLYSLTISIWKTNLKVRVENDWEEK